MKLERYKMKIDKRNLEKREILELIVILIKDNPGITHKELAKKIKITPKLLTEYMIHSRYLDEVVTDRIIGCNIHYFIKAKAEV